MICLHGVLLLMLWPAHVQTELMKFASCSFHPALLRFCVMAMIRFIFCALLRFVFPSCTVPFFALDLPSRVVAVADALSGMVHSDLLLLLVLLLVLILPLWCSLPSAQTTF
jgi:hypothetical protein